MPSSGVAMTDDVGDAGRPLERYRASLGVLAGAQFPAPPKGQPAASALVHQTLLQAHHKRDQFRGQTGAEFRAWPRTILARLLADAARRDRPRQAGRA